MLSDRPVQSGAAGTAGAALARPGSTGHPVPVWDWVFTLLPVDGVPAPGFGVGGVFFWPMVLHCFARAEHGILRGDSKEAFSRCEGGVNARIGVQR